MNSLFKCIVLGSCTVFSSYAIADIPELTVDEHTIRWNNVENNSWVQVLRQDNNEAVCEGNIDSCKTGLGLFTVIDHTDNRREDHVRVCQGITDWNFLLDQYHPLDSFIEDGEVQYTQSNTYTFQASLVVQKYNQDIADCWPLRIEPEHRECSAHRHHGDVAIPVYEAARKPNDFSFLKPYLRWHTDQYSEVNVPTHIPAIDDVFNDGLSDGHGLRVSSNIIYRECADPDTDAAGIPGPKGDIGRKGSRGPRGLSGEAGQTGSRGLPGLMGSSGIQGLPGNTGATGLTGLKGDDGMQGLQGASGAIGPQGDAGATGLAGPTGNDGIQGVPGATGSIGPQGDAGATGLAGPTGNDGIQGLPGATGSMGLQGDVGATGPTGPTGNDGIQGLQGAEGSIGPQGDVGATGAAGPIGNDGIQGAGGSIGPQGDAGEAGPAGPTGNDGIQGPQGVDGSIGLQGDVGSIGPEGEAGAEGPQGPHGLEGAIGPQGEVGVEGSVGPIGPQGEVGAEGPAGSIGDPGVAGPQGIDGIEGPQGEIGSFGPAGDQGVAGPQGVQGPQGDVGADGPKGDDGADGVNTNLTNCVVEIDVDEKINESPIIALLDTNSFTFSRNYPDCEAGYIRTSTDCMLSQFNSNSTTRFEVASEAERCAIAVSGTFLEARITVRSFCTKAVIVCK